MSAVQYTGDDGTTYQIEQPSAYSSSSAGNLPAAGGGEPLFTALYRPRHFTAFPSASPSGIRVSIVCDGNNPRFTSGPGTTFLLSSVSYTVADCFGEVRPQI